MNLYASLLMLFVVTASGYLLIEPVDLPARIALAACGFGMFAFGTSLVVLGTLALVSVWKREWAQRRGEP